jgi:hypothetical protein
MAMDTLRKTWRKQHPSFGEILEESTATVMEEADRLKKIVSDHGGRIAVADAPGGGARFAIELPLRNGTALLTSRI